MKYHVVTGTEEQPELIHCEADADPLTVAVSVDEQRAGRERETKPLYVYNETTGTATLVRCVRFDGKSHVAQAETSTFEAWLEQLIAGSFAADEEEA